MAADRAVRVGMRLRLRRNTGRQRRGIGVNPYEDNLRRLIREHIKAERVSLSKVAESIGLSYPTLNGFMTGTGSARDTTIDKIETYFARIQPNGEHMERTVSSPANGHAATMPIRKIEPPELPGFALQRPTVNINGEFGVRLDFDEASSRVTIKLLVAVRRFLGVDRDSRLYVYLSDDARSIALAVAPKDDTERAARMTADGVIAVTWLRQQLRAAGWANGTIPVASLPAPGSAKVVTIQCNGAAA